MDDLRESKEVDLRNGYTVIIREMSGGAMAAMMDAQGQKKSQVEVAAILVRHCVDGFRQETVEDIMDHFSAADLAALMEKIITLSEIGGADPKS